MRSAIEISSRFDGLDAFKFRALFRFLFPLFLSAADPFSPLQPSGEQQEVHRQTGLAVAGSTKSSQVKGGVCRVIPSGSKVKVISSKSIKQGGGLDRYVGRKCIHNE
jgi:hypothetical protein